MNDAPDREAIRRRARARAVSMGLATDAEPTPAPQVTLPTLRHGALKALLDRGHLTPEQASLARQLFAQARQDGTIPSETPKDAA